MMHRISLGNWANFEKLGRSWGAVDFRGDGELRVLRVADKVRGSGNRIASELEPILLGGVALPDISFESLWESEQGV